MAKVWKTKLKTPIGLTAFQFQILLTIVFRSITENYQLINLVILSNEPRLWNQVIAILWMIEWKSI